MLNKILSGCIFNIVTFWAFYELCRWNTAYFPELKFNNYVVIKNKVIAKILIPKAIGRDRIVDRCDCNELPVVGLVSLIIGMPINLFNLIISFMNLLNYKGINKLCTIVLIIVVILMVLNILVCIINTFDCGRK